MPKTFYSQYVNHCLRFYTRYPKPKLFRSDADMLNWTACKNALEEFPEQDREMLLTIYRGGDTIADNVYQMSEDKGVAQDYIWKLINNLEYRIAKIRGLL